MSAIYKGTILNTVRDWNWYVSRAGSCKYSFWAQSLNTMQWNPYYQLQPWWVLKICIEVKTNVWELSQMQAAQAFAGNNDLRTSRWNFKHMVSGQNWYHKSEPRGLNFEMSIEAVKCSSRILQKSSETSYLKCQQAGYCNILFWYHCHLQLKIVLRIAGKLCGLKLSAQMKGKLR